MGIEAVEVDFSIEDCGSVWRIQPLSEAAREWVESEVYSEPWQWLGGSLVVDHRMAGDLVDGILSEGFSIC